MRKPGYSWSLEKNWTIAHQRPQKKILSSLLCTLYGGETVLIDVYAPSNDLFWQIKNQFFETLSYTLNSGLQWNK